MLTYKFECDRILSVAGHGDIDCMIRDSDLGIAQFGRALEWGSRGRRFNSCHSDAAEKPQMSYFRAFAGFCLLVGEFVISPDLR